MTPPRISPAIFIQFFSNPRVKKKVMDSDTVTKNSAKFTDPMRFPGVMAVRQQGCRHDRTPSTTAN